MFSPLVLIHMLTTTTVIMSAAKPTDTMMTLHQSEENKNMKYIWAAAFCSIQNPVAQREQMCFLQREHF